MASNSVDLSCAACGSNRLQFPLADEEPVVCEDCGAGGRSLHDVKLLLANSMSRARNRVKPDKRAERRERHTSEVEKSQADLRENVAEADRLVAASDKMLRRHRKECDEEDGA
jgi:hypothetical protein